MRLKLNYSKFFEQQQTFQLLNKSMDKAKSLTRQDKRKAKGRERQKHRKRGERQTRDKRREKRERMPSTGESEASDFGIPQEILKILPPDPYDQLDVACKITSLAISTRVAELESLSSALRAELADRDALISELRSRADSLDASLAAAADRLAAADIEKVPPLSTSFLPFQTPELSRNLNDVLLY